MHFQRSVMLRNKPHSVTLAGYTYSHVHHPGGGGGGGYSPQILVGMCRGKVKNGPGLRNELLVKRENAGLRIELEPFFSVKNAGLRNGLDAVLSVKMRVSGTARTRLAAAAERFAFGLSWPWEAMNGLKLRKCWKLWSPERQNPQQQKVKWWCSGADILVICENDNAPERKFRAKNGGLSRGTYPICIHMEVPPPPPRDVTLW